MYTLYMHSLYMHPPPVHPWVHPPYSTVSPAMLHGSPGVTGVPR